MALGNRIIETYVLNTKGKYKKKIIKITHTSGVLKRNIKVGRDFIKMEIKTGQFTVTTRT